MKMFYNGYFAEVDISLEDDLFYGKISGISDIVMFDGKTPSELKKSFEKAVDDYKETCKQLNKEVIKYCGCGVPLSLHNTCCGWENANLILYPKNKLEIEWQKQQLQATNSTIVISGDGASISKNIISL